ncbi:hypothetical protein, partial [Actinacidiphila rubida]|uniref:hypothetical protein n=1 Tax=Actinacidiphila rubida TaxID=310780 RepID=UPI001C401BCB
MTGEPLVPGGDQRHVGLAVARVDGQDAAGDERFPRHAHARCSRLCARSRSVRPSAQGPNA